MDLNVDDVKHEDPLGGNFDVFGIGSPVHDAANRVAWRSAQRRV